MEASKHFRIGTAMSVDMLHPRHCAQLGEAYCEWVAGMLTTLERRGLLIEELDAFCIAMLAKPEGDIVP